ncbi:energy-coupling factor transporter transmembrane component T [Paenibacillus vini]|uniref:energy-coupling factor transporter transmembrane component T family protein n=1 Tax=Paenibacillus vini TaxID=1476024 RepID=UPI0025B697DF|nr:energy-coupling factor transporter transmembrane component T [Paenibacillus vini]MDN4070743.1 energy-coupling factor transporter transmembrane component T [Paenibacillus vini]
MRKQGQYPLHKLDPLSKLISLFCIAMLAMHWDKPLPLCGLLLLLTVSALSGAGMSWGRLASRMGYIAVFGLPLFVLTTLASPGGGEYWALGGIRISSEAILYAAAITLRMFCLFISSLIYIETTDPQDFVIMMTTRLKLPYRFVFGISMALTFLPLLEQERRSAAEARKIRYGRKPRGLGERFGVWRENLVAVFAGAIRRVEQTAGSMETKGFGAYRSRTFLREVKVSAGGYALMIISIAAATGLWFLI